MFSVLVIRLRSLRLLRVSGIVMRLRMFLLLITFLKASHSFRNRLLVICKNAYLFRSEERFSRNAETDVVCRLLLAKKKIDPFHVLPLANRALDDVLRAYRHDLPQLRDR